MQQMTKPETLQPVPESPDPQVYAAPKQAEFSQFITACIKRPHRLPEQSSTFTEAKRNRWRAHRELRCFWCCWGHGAPQPTPQYGQQWLRTARQCPRLATAHTALPCRTSECSCRQQLLLLCTASQAIYPARTGTKPLFCIRRKTLMTVKKNGGVVAKICPGVVHKIKVGAVWLRIETVEALLYVDRTL